MGKRKVFIVIANYGESQEKELLEMLKEFNEFKKYEINILLLSTEKTKNLNYKKLKIKEIVYNKSIEIGRAHV